MSPLRLIDPTREARKRALRLEIARLRRRIERHGRSSWGELAALGSWRTYVRHYPGASLAAAFGLGYVLSRGLRPGRLATWVAGRTLDRALAAAFSLAASQIVGLWQGSRRRGEPAAGAFDARGEGTAQCGSRSGQS